jgi:4-diphosphocytidyl-2C-methyl-D-erythritol kinase
LYGGGINDWIFKNKIDVSKVQKQYKNCFEVLEFADITEFRLEQEEMNKIIMDKNPHLKEVITAKGKFNLTEKILAGSCSAFFLEEIFKYCLDKECIRNDNCVLCADGLMLEIEFVSPLY